MKNALAIMPESTATLFRVARPDCRLSAEDLRSLVDIAIDAKLQVMDADPREKGRGLALEYGHTIGHAIELAAPGLLSHGEAVGVGMLCAAEIAARSYALGPTDLEAHRTLLGSIGVSKELARGADPARIHGLLRFDNKRGYVSPGADELPMILLDGVGKVRWNGATPLTPVAMRDVEQTLASLPGA